MKKNNYYILHSNYGCGCIGSADTLFDAKNIAHKYAENLNRFNMFNTAKSFSIYKAEDVEDCKLNGADDMFARQSVAPVVSLKCCGCTMVWEGV